MSGLFDFDTGLFRQDGSGQCDFDEFQAWWRDQDDAVRAKMEELDEMERLKDMWEKFDEDGGGTLGAQEILALFRSVGRKVSPDDFKVAMLEIDTDGSGEADFDEFAAWWRRQGMIVQDQLQETEQDWTEKAVGEGYTYEIIGEPSFDKPPEEASVRKAFDEIDEDGGGTLDREELGLLSRKLGKELTDTELDAMMAEIDVDGGGDVDFEEFYAWWQSADGGVAAELKEKMKEVTVGQVTHVT